MMTEIKLPNIGDIIIVSNGNMQKPVEARFVAYNKHNIRPWVVMRNGRMMKFKVLEGVVS